MELTLLTQWRQFSCSASGASRRCGFVAIQDLKHSFPIGIMTLAISMVKRLEIVSYFFGSPWTDS